MEHITDELLNKYIDGELSSEEIKELEEYISTDSAAIEKLKALRMVDEVLNKMEKDKAPINITEKVITQITSFTPKKYYKNHFFVGMMSFFAVAIIGLLSYFLTSYTPSGTGSSYVEPVAEKINLFVVNGVGKFTSVIESNNFLLVIASIMMIIMFAIYFLFESHRSFKKKLDSFVH